MAESAYSKKLRDPQWQKVRLLVLERDAWKCRFCGADWLTLHVHHTYYERGADPWDYPVDSLLTLCETCHETEHLERAANESALLAVLRHLGVSSALLGELAWFAETYLAKPESKTWVNDWLREALAASDQENSDTAASAIALLDSGAIGDEDLPFPAAGG